MRLGLVCGIVLLAAVLTGSTAAAADAPGDVQRRAAERASAPALGPRAERPPEIGDLAERVTALEKENLVLREDLGKARLDVVSRIADLERRNAEAQARLQERIDALNSDLAAERERQDTRNRRLWLALGIVAIAALVSD